MAKKNTLSDLRNTFLSFFEKNGHEILPSASLVPEDDPTLMFVNAGMAPFKNIFTGKEKSKFKRVTTSQKCVRAGGKHNDLENVGYTARHHTFFEMLGNFSFGDYFKEEAIKLAWELVTKEFALDPNKLLVTVYHTDDEAYNLWKKVASLPDSKILRIPTADNFWSMGDRGPCGPCSEIFYDHGDHIFGGPPGSKDEDGDRFIEIWNLVFMQFDQTDEGQINLPKPSIDTGMGLERMSALIQGSHDNYQTDLFKDLISAISDITHVKENDETRPSLRVIADHLRSTSFLIADGVFPSNEGRGYVLRRIMRRAMRHAEILGAQEPIMHKVFPTLENLMKDAYPDLVNRKELITSVIEQEEIRFKETLSRGLSLLEAETQNLKKGDKLDGEIAFKLYDTYGFPLDLTEDALKNRGITVDREQFDKAMQKQKDEAKLAWSGSGDAVQEKIWFDLFDEFGKTNFIGYEKQEAKSKIKSIVHDGEIVSNVNTAQKCFIILDKTPFYAESGGQLSDIGFLENDKGEKLAKVTDVKKRGGGLFVHEVETLQPLHNLQDIVAKIDVDYRDKICINHSATHLLHQSLRDILGDHVAQKGSYVGPDRLRFDFSHMKSLSDDEKDLIENKVNQVIANTGDILIEEMPKDEAIKLGAKALFGEKYGDSVRVVIMGSENKGDNKPYSIELCGGTHVKNVSDISLLHIVSETAVASGVRRIEALSGQAAIDYFRKIEADKKSLAKILKSSDSEILEKVENLVNLSKDQAKIIQELKQKIALLGDGSSSSQSDVEKLGDINFYAKAISGVELNQLKPLADEAKQKIKSGIVVIIAQNEEGNKVGIVVGVTDDLTKQFNAVDFVKIGSEALGGKGGGGRPDMAQAGGVNFSDAQKAIDLIKSKLI